VSPRTSSAIQRRRVMGQFSVVSYQFSVNAWKGILGGAQQRRLAGWRFT
jgi:hypothetical protein